MQDQIHIFSPIAMLLFAWALIDSKVCSLLRVSRMLFLETHVSFKMLICQETSDHSGQINVVQ